jgi:hypothetical protein
MQAGFTGPCGLFAINDLLPCVTRRAASLQSVGYRRDLEIIEQHSEKCKLPGERVFPFSSAGRCRQEKV